MIPFVKLEAAGNAYLAVDGRDEERDWSRLARSICAHHTGVGSDGLLVVCEARRAPLRMRVFNSDGSEAEMSGNGLRLISKFVLDRQLAGLSRGALRVETGGGVRTVWPELERGKVVGGRIAMGVPQLTHEGRDTVLELEQEPLEVTTLAIGNPHAVHLTDRPVAEFPLQATGATVQAHPSFPDSVNFEVVRVLTRTTVEARIFERGEGETRSSGTGSTAAAVAARLAGLTDATVDVHLPGGALRVTFERPGAEAFLEGPTVEVFSGIWPRST